MEGDGVSCVCARRGRAQYSAMDCVCGFSCGTAAAFLRYDEDDEGLAVVVERGTGAP